MAYMLDINKFELRIRSLQFYFSIDFAARMKICWDSGILSAVI